MKVGLMGGTFDPIHKAHTELAKYAMLQYGLEKVIFMTGGNPPHKSAMTDAKSRFEMVRLAISGIPKTEAYDYEINLPEPSYSVNTLKWLSQTYPEIYFIIGEDSLSSFENWYEPEKILKYCTLIVYPRKSVKTLENTIERVKSKFGGKIEKISAPIYDISSTEIRKILKDGGDASKYLDARVLRYIQENKLYGSGDND